MLSDELVCFHAISFFIKKIDKNTVGFFIVHYVQINEKKQLVSALPGPKQGSPGPRPCRSARREPTACFGRAGAERGTFGLTSAETACFGPSRADRGLVFKFL